MFKFLSGGIKGLLERIIFQIIGVEQSANVGWHADKKKAKKKEKEVKK
jgi:hypothetical protein